MVPILHYTTREQPRIQYPDGTVVPGRLVVDDGVMRLVVDTPADLEIHGQQDVHAVGRVLEMRAAAAAVPAKYQDWRTWIQARYADAGLAVPTTGLGGGTASTIRDAAAALADAVVASGIDPTAAPSTLEILDDWRRHFVAQFDGGASLVDGEGK